MSLILMSPWITRLVDATAGILVLVVALYFLGSTQLKQLPLGKLQRFLPILLLFAFVPDVNANTPDPRILDELESRLSSSPDCLPDCASAESIEVILDKSTVTIKARIHSLGSFAVPLPTVSLTTPDLSIHASGKQIPITRTSQGTLAALLSEGISSVVISTGIDTANAFDIEFPMNPSRIVLVHDGWQATGIANGVLTGKRVQFSRTVVTEDTAQEELIQERATPYVKVERQIRFRLETEVITYVRRLAPIEGAFRAQVPLLPGEEVYETDGTVEDGSVIVDFDSEQDYVYWLSRMDTPTSLRLIAPDLSERVEVWTISGSDHWHWSSEGLSPVMSKTDGAEFLPRSRDSLTVELQKPLPVPGESSTIESVAATYSIGTRLLTGNLALRINATQGSEVNLELPEGAQVQEIEVTVGRDTTEYPPSEDHIVTLPHFARRVCVPGRMEIGALAPVAIYIARGETTATGSKCRCSSRVPRESLDCLPSRASDGTGGSLLGCGDRDLSDCRWSVFATEFPTFAYRCSDSFTRCNPIERVGVIDCWRVVCSDMAERQKRSAYARNG